MLWPQAYRRACLVRIRSLSDLIIAERFLWLEACFFFLAFFWLQQTQTSPSEASVWVQSHSLKKDGFREIQTAEGTSEWQSSFYDRKVWVWKCGVFNGMDRKVWISSRGSFSSKEIGKLEQNLTEVEMRLSKKNKAKLKDLEKVEKHKKCFNMWKKEAEPSR